MSLEFSQRQVESLEKVNDLVYSRPNYLEGKEKLNFTYKFSTGEVLSATEDENGVAQIEVRRAEKKVFDFHEIVPKSVKFTTPTFYIKKGAPMVIDAQIW
ncbi:MAG: hypothetical protein V4699_00800, partial [Patescibacteria group bacterium]